MADPTPKDISVRLSKQLAAYKLSPGAIKAITDRVLIDGLRLVKLGPCPTGICGDYRGPGLPRLDKLKPERAIARIDIFPEGIIDWDSVRVRIEFEAPELRGNLLAGGISR